MKALGELLAVIVLFVAVAIVAITEGIVEVVIGKERGDGQW